MLPLSTADWTKICNQKLAIRMARRRDDVTGHAYGLYEMRQASTTVEMLLALQSPPDNWYHRLFNTVSMIMDFTVGNPQASYLVLIRDTSRCDNHYFNATGLRRGDGKTFPRVNLSLADATPTVASHYFMDSPHPLIRSREHHLEAFCDMVIRMIKQA